MAKPIITIDIVSDVMCPWCIIGYKRLEKAMDEWGDRLEFNLTWHPFELNPGMPQGGQNLREFLARKYGTTLEGSITARKKLTDLGAELGFTFDYFDEMGRYNTFKAHQLIHWSKAYGKQTKLKLRLFSAYFGERKAIDDPLVLLKEVEQVGLNVDEAKDVLENETYAKIVTNLEAEWMGRGIHSIPAVIFNEKHLISGAQPTEVFKAQLQELVEAI